MWMDSQGVWQRLHGTASLRVADSHICDAGRGLFSMNDLEDGVSLGRVSGAILLVSDTYDKAVDYALQQQDDRLLLLKRRRMWCVVSARGSVFEFANCSACKDSENIHISESGWVETVGDVHEGDELTWWYGDLHAAAFGARVLQRIPEGNRFIESKMRSEYIAFNMKVLAKEKRCQWPDSGALRISLGVGQASAMLTYVEANHQASRGRLRLNDMEGTVIGAYANYRSNHHVERGGRHRAAEQHKHNILITSNVFRLVRRELPGFDDLVNAATRWLPENEVDGNAIEPTHAHILHQTSDLVCFSDHQDTEEEVPSEDDVALGICQTDRHVIYTAVIELSNGGETAMQILGHDDIVFNGRPGDGVLFKSELWHRTQRATGNIWKLTIFFGYFVS